MNDVLKNFGKITGYPLCQILFLINMQADNFINLQIDNFIEKETAAQVCPVNLVNSFRTHFKQNTTG